MITLHNNGVFLAGGVPAAAGPVSPEEGRKRTMAWSILQAHNISGDPEHLQIRFDAMVSHDITYVGIIQTGPGLRHEGVSRCPMRLPTATTACVPWAAPSTRMTTSSASLPRKSTAVVYVPANQAVIHSYMRESRWRRRGTMILGSDSHTRYGALRHHGRGRGRPGAGQAAAEEHLGHQLSQGGAGLPHRRAPPGRGAPGRGAWPW